MIIRTTLIYYFYKKYVFIIFFGSGKNKYPFGSFLSPHSIPGYFLVPPKIMGY